MNATGTSWLVSPDGYLVHRKHTESRVRKEFLKAKFSRKDMDVSEEHCLIVLARGRHTGCDVVLGVASHGCTAPTWSTRLQRRAHVHVTMPWCRTFHLSSSPNSKPPLDPS